MYPGDPATEANQSRWGKLLRRPLWQKLYLSGVLMFVLLTVLTYSARFLPRAAVEIALGTLLIVGGVLIASGFIAWCWPLIVRLWRLWIGRVFLVILNALVLLLATALARLSVSASLQLPPQDFDLTVALFALPNYVFVWYFLLSVVTSVTGVTLFLVAGAKVIAGPRNQHPGWDLLHAVGALAVTGLMIGPFEMASKYLLDREFVRLVAYAVDFHEAANYPGVLAKERVRLHENGIVSSAVLVSGKVIITTQKRNF